MIDVKLFRITTGEEVVAELVSETEDTVTLRNGLVVIPSGSSYGFAQWATVIDPDQPDITVNRKFIVYTVPVAEAVEKRYNEIYGSKLVTPEKKKLIV